MHFLSLLVHVLGCRPDSDDSSPEVDADSDGYAAGVDCDDTSTSVAFNHYIVGQ